MDAPRLTRDNPGREDAYSLLGTVANFKDIHRTDAFEFFRRLSVAGGKKKCAKHNGNQFYIHDAISSDRILGER